MNSRRRFLPVTRRITASTLLPVIHAEPSTAERAGNWPNAITICRLALLLPYLACIASTHPPDPWRRRLALALLIVMSLSDVLDGFLARRLHQVTRLGGILDPLSDKLLTLGSLFTLAVDRLAVPGFEIPNWVPAVALSKDLLTVGGAAWIRWKHRCRFFEPRVLGKACTALQWLLIGMVLLGPDLADAIPAMPGIVRIGCWVVTGLAAATWVDYAVAGQRAVAKQGIPT